MKIKFNITYFFTAILFFNGASSFAENNFKRNIDRFVSHLVTSQTVRAVKLILLRAVICIVFAHALKKTNQTFLNSNSSNESNSLKNLARFGTIQWAPHVVSEVVPEQASLLFNSMKQGSFFNAGQAIILLACAFISILPEWMLIKTFVKAVQEAGKDAL
jgi:hypothetical protein